MTLYLPPLNSNYQWSAIQNANMVYWKFILTYHHDTEGKFCRGGTNFQYLPGFGNFFGGIWSGVGGGTPNICGGAGDTKPKEKSTFFMQLFQYPSASRIFPRFAWGLRIVWVCPHCKKNPGVWPSFGWDWPGFYSEQLGLPKSWSQNRQDQPSLAKDWPRS